MKLKRSLGIFNSRGIAQSGADDLTPGFFANLTRYQESALKDMAINVCSRRQLGKSRKYSKRSLLSKFTMNCEFTAPAKSNRCQENFFGSSDAWHHSLHHCSDAWHLKYLLRSRKELGRVIIRDFTKPTKFCIISSIDQRRKKSLPTLPSNGRYGYCVSVYSGYSRTG